MRRLIAAAVGLVLALALTACGSDRTTLRILAASSLTDVFTQLAKTFEAEHPGVDVQLSFGSSTDLAAQAKDGAPGDVLATADHDSLLAAGPAATAHDGAFATNVLVIATAPGNADHIRSLADLAGHAWVRCDPAAPCGKVADEVLAAQHVTTRPKSDEPDARATLDKVVSGEADAALVYASDARSAGSAVTAVPIPGADKAKADYFISPLDQSAHLSLATGWTDLVLSRYGRKVLTAAGFGTP
ncbi:molybdate ABC transporter substrate-binding protein [Nocardioides montaniterrae]